ncbi:MAG: sugar ABC transporter substrate-binding protein [Flexilinea sp.]
MMNKKYIVVSLIVVLLLSVSSAFAQDSTGKTRDDVLVGYACMNAADSFHSIVSAGVQAEAEKLGYKLVIVDNAFDAVTAVNNANDLIAMGVDIIIETTRDAQGVGTTIKEACDEAGVKIISVDTAIPDTPFFGGNNEEAGGMGGEYLSEAAKAKWGDDVVVDLVISLEAPAGGTTNDARMDVGFLQHLKAQMDIDDSIIYRVQGNTVETGMQQTEDIINAHPDAKHILIASFVEAGAQGSEAAIEKMNMVDSVVLCTVEYGALAKANYDNGKDNIAWTGSVSLSPDLYAQYIFEKIDDYYLNGIEFPERWYAPSTLITVENYMDYPDPS